MKKIIFKNKKRIFFIITNIRPVYYIGKLNNKKIISKVRISKEKFYNNINRLKKLNSRK